MTDRHMSGSWGDAAASRGTASPAVLRTWQREAVHTWVSMQRPRDFLAEATPGAGKTTFALHLVAQADSSRLAERDTLCVVCPTSHLRKQWQAAACRHGIELCTEITGGELHSGFRGAALTYQQVLADPERYRRAVGTGWIILDECHHAGEGKSWADALQHAFGGARHRLSLSGTAFRSDAARIPFIRYDEDGVSVADYRYPYGQALGDGVVRPIFFVSFGGDTAWYKGGRMRRAGFGEVISREDSAARLRTALDPAGGWMRHALSRAHQRLLEVRSAGHPDAGALVVCMDQVHARRVADFIETLTDVAPAVALSDDPGASAVIARFAAGREPWIVAVRQVSEGTDIPRLRVGVWATNASTELFFRQVVGRLVRIVSGLREQHAYLYLPADPALLRHARALAEERSHHLREGPTASDPDQRTATLAAGEADFRALGSTAAEAEIVFGSHVVAPAEIARAKAVAEQCGLSLEDPLAFAFALREAAGPGCGSDVPLEAKRRALRTLLTRRVREFCGRTGTSHRDAYARLKQRAGRPVGRLNEAWLGTHIRTVEGWVAREPSIGGGNQVEREGSS
ncbi:MAG TPA: DEAD/DEAH box helicase family protein [Longimicrobiaceae bacterium]|nr:DEAD/DEAH box helicase family protein [Longimicrobiaceae bacterium]